jgi:hypothetical protein
VFVFVFVGTTAIGPYSVQPTASTSNCRIIARLIGGREAPSFCSSARLYIQCKLACVHHEDVWRRGGKASLGSDCKHNV